MKYNNCFIVFNTSGKPLGEICSKILLINVTGCKLKFVYIYLFICGWVGDGGAGWCLYGEHEGVGSLFFSSWFKGIRLSSSGLVARPLPPKPCQLSNV